MNSTLARFGTAFVIGVCVAGAVLIVARGGDDTPAAFNLPETPEPGSSSSSTIPTTTTTSPATDNTTSTSPPTTTAEETLPTLQLPTPDLNTHCVDEYGDSASARRIDTSAPAVGCFNDDTALDDGLSVKAVCENQVWEASRAVLLSATGDWRCVPPERIEVGAPDFDMFCLERWGEGSIAALYADDVFGWRCATRLNGIFSYRSIPMDDACQVTYRGATFGDRIDDSVDGWRCYTGPGT